MQHKCPKCGKQTLDVRTSVQPEGLKASELGWNKDHSAYTEGVVVYDLECTECGFSDSDVSVYD